MTAAAFVIAAAMAILLVGRASASSLRPAKSRVKSVGAPLRSTLSLTQRLASIVAELNAVLLVFAIGLAVLDLSAMLEASLPNLAALAADGDQPDYALATVDSGAPALSEGSFQ